MCGCIVLFFVFGLGGGLFLVGFGFGGEFGGGVLFCFLGDLRGFYCYVYFLMSCWQLQFCVSKEFWPLTKNGDQQLPLIDTYY